MDYFIIKNGKPLDPKLYDIDVRNKIFRCKEHFLVLIFSECDWTFYTGDNCVFTALANCVFHTGDGCIFNTLYNCKFYTGNFCVFKTAHNCSFNTGRDCTFRTGYGCTFRTTVQCTFRTGNGCVFCVESDCIFSIIMDAYIKTSDRSPVILLQCDNNPNSTITSFTKPNTIIHFHNKGEQKIWANNDLVLNCKNPLFKDMINFYLKNR